MKTQKRLNILLVILVIVLVSLVSFGGIYYKNKNQMINRLPNYILGEDLKGYREVTLVVAESNEEETETESEEEIAEEENSEVENQAEEETASEENTSNEIEGNSSEEENTVSEDKAEKSNNNLTADNYRKSADVFRNRLKSLNVENYTVSCDENTGRIVITIPENDQTDTILSDIVEKGEFTIKDSNTEEVLLSNSDIRNVDVGIQQATTYSSVYMNINFNNKGTQKFKNITATYQNQIEENTVEEENEADNELAEETTYDGEKVEENTTEDDTEDAEETTTKQVIMSIDESTMMTTNFTEIIDNGVLSLTVGTATTDEDLVEKLYGAQNIKAIIENEALPIDYSIESNAYIASIIEESMLKIIIYVEIAVAAVIAVVLIIKYKKNGIMAAILSVGFIAILLIIIRYTNVSLSLEGILGIGLSYIVNSIFGFMLCEGLKEKELTDKEKKKLFKNITRKYSLILIPSLIIAIVCCFTSWAAIFSFGMVMFWGVVISWIWNILLTKFLVR